VNLHSSPTRVIVLAAGSGTRLHPYTADRPKCLVPLGGIPLLHRQLAVLRDAGLTDITLVCGFAADKDDAPGCRKVLNPEYASTNMVTSLFCAAEVMKDDADLLITYGDIVFEPTVLAAILDCRAPIATVSDRGWRELWSERMADPLQDTETFRLGPDRRVTDLGRRPLHLDEIQGQYIGLTKIRADYVSRFVADRGAMRRDDLIDGKTHDALDMTTFLRYLIGRGWPLFAVEVEHGWLEVDSVQDLARYEQLMRLGTLARLYDERATTGDRRAVPPAAPMA